MYKPSNLIKIIMENGRELVVPTDKEVSDIEKDLKEYNVLVFGKQVIQSNEVKSVDLVTKTIVPTKDGKN